MKTTEKIIISAIIGTTFMTLYSYWRSKKEQQEYTEPVMINKLIDNSENLPQLNNQDIHPAGWGLHYLTGVAFVSGYWVIWKKALKRPTLFRISLIGSLSGITGIIVWKALFMQHDNAPKNYRYGYYKQLFFAHIIFTAFALITYKSLERIGNKTEMI